MPSDPKPEPRIVDPTATARACLIWRVCAVCELPSATGHHVISRQASATAPRGDDLVANIVPLCGSGTTGCHGLVENENPIALAKLGKWIIDMRPDTMAYLIAKLGGREAAHEWLRTRLYAPI